MRKVLVAKPQTGYRAKPVEAKTNDDGSVTLSVTCFRTGMILLVK